MISHFIQKLSSTLHKGFWPDNNKIVDLSWKHAPPPEYFHISFKFCFHSCLIINLRGLHANYAVKFIANYQNEGVKELYPP